MISEANIISPVFVWLGPVAVSLCCYVSLLRGGAGEVNEEEERMMNE